MKEYTIRHTRGYVEVYDAQGKLWFTADTVREAEEEIRNGEAA